VSSKACGSSREKLGLDLDDVRAVNPTSESGCSDAPA